MRVKYVGEWTADLEPGKEYRVLAVSAPFPRIPFIRIVDESNEDYLYPIGDFEFLEGWEECKAIADDVDKCPREVEVA